MITDVGKFKAINSNHQIQRDYELRKLHESFSNKHSCH